jgi:hypothetical protein
MRLLEVKLRLSFLTVKLTSVNQSMQEKLINLGIDVWKKRPELTSPLLEKEIFLIDKDIILLLGKKDKVLPKKDKEYFFRTLTKSIGRQDFKQLNKLSQSKEVTNIFLLDTDSPNDLEQLMNVNIVSFPSITEICSSRENKEKFLVSLLKLNL